MSDDQYEALAKGVDSREIKWIIEHVGEGRESRFNNLNVDQQEQVLRLLDRRSKGEPLAYVLNEMPFMGLSFYVDSNVLIPRPETEQLVEMIIDKLKGVDLKGLTLVDMCTGSGCVAISLKKYLPQLHVIGVDISVEALSVAKKNSARLDVDVEWVQSNLFDQYAGKIDYLVSNPPYVSLDEYKELDGGVKDYEPKLALIADNQGLDFYCRILDYIANASPKIRRAWMEIGESQGGNVITEATHRLPSIYKASIHKDYFNKDRFFFLECD